MRFWFFCHCFQINISIYIFPFCYRGFQAFSPENVSSADLFISLPTQGAKRQNHTHYYRTCHFPFSYPPFHELGRAKCSDVKTTSWISIRTASGQVGKQPSWCSPKAHWSHWGLSVDSSGLCNRHIVFSELLYLHKCILSSSIVLHGWAGPCTP